MVAGGLQAIGAAVNAELRGVLVNPWLTADVSFVSVALIVIFAFVLRPRPLPRPSDLKGFRWWMPLAGTTGAVAVTAGLLFIDQVGAGAFNGLLITVNLLARPALYHFGWLGMRKAPFSWRRGAGGFLMPAGVGLISIGR